MSKLNHWLTTFLVLLVLIGFALVTVILFALDADNGVSFVIGIFWALLFLAFLWAGRVLWRKGHKVLVGFIGLFCFLAANVIVTLMVVNPQSSVWKTLKPRFLSLPRVPIASYGIQGRSINREAVQVTEYQLTLTPVEQSIIAFQVKVNIRLQENGQEKSLGFTQPDAIQSRASQQGWLLKEVQLALPEKTLAQFTWKEGNLSREAQNVCCFRPVKITLKDVPKSVFYEAKNAVNVKRATYGNTETIEWEVQDPWGESEQAMFSIVPPPYNRFPFIHRFASLSSVADWVFTLGGMLGSSLLVSLLIPVLKDVGQEKVKRSLKNIKKDQKQSKASTSSEEHAENGIAPLAQHLSKRLTREQFLALRNEIEELLNQK